MSDDKKSKPTEKLGGDSLGAVDRPVSASTSKPVKKGGGKK